MLDEVSLVVVQLVLPVVEIGGEVDLLGCPEGGLSLLVHLPDLGRVNAWSWGCDGVTDEGSK